MVDWRNWSRVFLSLCVGAILLIFVAGFFCFLIFYTSRYHSLAQHRTKVYDLHGTLILSSLPFEVLVSPMYCGWDDDHHKFSISSVGFVSLWLTAYRSLGVDKPRDVGHFFLRRYWYPSLRSNCASAPQQQLLFAADEHPQIISAL